MTGDNKAPANVAIEITDADADGTPEAVTIDGVAAEFDGSTIRGADGTPFHEVVAMPPDDRDGQTPFIRAALSGDITVMRLLLEHGADPAIATRKGTTALMAAAGLNWKPTQTFTR